jgi:hypothetical protein
MGRLYLSTLPLLLRLLSGKPVAAYTFCRELDAMVPLKCVALLMILHTVVTTLHGGYIIW